MFQTDDIAMTNGHLVLRLPVRHCELNPIELIKGNAMVSFNTTLKYQFCFCFNDDADDDV